MTVQEMSQAAYARHKKVSRKTVTVWKNIGRVVLLPNGKVDVAKSDRLLAERPIEYRGGATRSVTCEDGAAFPVGNTIGEVTEDFSRGALWMAIEVVRRVGGFGAMATLDGGGSCAVAYGAKKIIEAAFTEELAGVLRDRRVAPFDADHDPSVWPTECVDVNWAKCAAAQGEMFDMEAWEASWKSRPAALQDSER